MADHNARRERIAAQIYASWVGFDEYATPQEVARRVSVVARQAIVCANAFIEHFDATVRKDAPDAASPSLLEAGRVVLDIWDSGPTSKSMNAACRALREAIEREEARHG